MHTRTHLHARIPAGMDVARKVIILARECGLQIELDSLVLESLVPEPLARLDSADDFMEKLPEVGCQCVCQRVVCLVHLCVLCVPAHDCMCMFGAHVFCVRSCTFDCMSFCWFALSVLILPKALSSNTTLLKEL